MSKRVANELADLIDNDTTVPFVKNVVIHTVENTHPLVARSETFEEIFFGREAYYPVRAASQHQRRRSDRARISSQSLCVIVQTEQDIHGDTTRDKWVFIVTTSFHRIVREQASLHITRNKHPLPWKEGLHQSQPEPRKRNIELYAQRGSRKHHAAHRRAVIMDPLCERHRSDAVTQYDHVFKPNLVKTRNVTNEFINVAR